MGLGLATSSSATMSDDVLVVCYGAYCIRVCIGQYIAINIGTVCNNNNNILARMTNNNNKIIYYCNILGDQYIFEQHWFMLLTW